jgi:uncharacterized protein (TIGR04255 family)
MSVHPQLKSPPIEEVVCGFMFEPTGLTALDFGVYGESRKDGYPSQELRAVTNGAAILTAGGFQQRVWLVSANDAIILQMQHDAFWVNWRKRGVEYPRFSDHGDKGGLLTLALREFRRFSEWAQARSGRALVIKSFELSKIDSLRQGEDYDSFEDVKSILPVVEAFASIPREQPREQPKSIHFRLDDVLDDCRTVVQISVQQDRTRIETMHTFTGDDYAEAFRQANRRVNDVFFGLVHGLEATDEALA